MFKSTGHPFAFLSATAHKSSQMDSVLINVETSSSPPTTHAYHLVLQECSTRASNAWALTPRATFTSAFTSKRCASAPAHIWWPELNASRTAHFHTKKIRSIHHNASGSANHISKMAIVLTSAILEFTIQQIECVWMTGQHAHIITISQLISKT